jgi:hypothetical protein
VLGTKRESFVCVVHTLDYLKQKLEAWGRKGQLRVLASFLSLE